MTPATYRNGGKGMFIRYTTLDSPVGRMLMAATDHGVCAISFGDSDGVLLEGLRREFPDATLRRGDVVLRRWVRALLDRLHGERPLPQLPLDVQATAFQRRVWEHLRSIPYGTTRSYGDVARAIGSASGARAVARACASNPVAVAIPCHRVVRSTGDLGGYRWGLERKKVLLAMEQGAGKES
jgi:AraC family transcriptional regulator of adaptative response/methylated-DNA-[protein]-cysteine methyltransferase